ncbi:hypothetical protein Tco_0355693 [Tanacetum coccineum]
MKIQRIKLVIGKTAHVSWIQRKVPTQSLQPLHIPVSCQVGEDVVDSTTTSHLIISQEPIFSPILDTKSQDYEDFFILSKEEEECLDSLEELLSYVEQDAEVTPTDLNPPQLPRVVINQVEEDDLIFKNEKEQVKVSLVREEHHVVERYHETSLSTLTHIIVKQVNRKA